MLVLSLLVFLHACSFVAAAHALLTKRDPGSALGWSAALIFLPVGGLISYLIFGISRAQSRAEQIMRKEAKYAENIEEYEICSESALTMISSEAKVMNTLGSNLTSLHLCPGNFIKPLYNGDEAYPAMLDAIKSAREHVFLSTYIFNYGYAAQMFIDALLYAHKQRVDVRVLVDGIGRLYSWKQPIGILAKEGIKTTVFRPMSLVPPKFGINLRSHRKVLICDAIGFTGGMNISDGNMLKLGSQKKSLIQDMQFRCEGPIVNQMRRAFLINWAFCTNELTTLPYLKYTNKGNCSCRVVVDGPGDDKDTLSDLICGSINIARRKIRIMTPYFLPPAPLAAALQSAARRGVDVRVVLPGHNNLAYVDWAMRHILPHFLQAGVRCWYQIPPFAHTKLLVIDDFYSLIGSANLDSRSLLLNFELDMEIYDKDINEELGEFIDNASNSGKEISLYDLQRQSLPVRLRNAASWIFSPYF